MKVQESKEEIDMATVVDVAKKAKVCPSTVSRYIRSPELVSKEKAKVIEKAINELGYTRNLGASFLKSCKTNIVGLVLPSNYNTFFASLLAKINVATKALNKQLIVLYASDFDEVKNQIRVLLSLRAESILFIPERKSHTIRTLTFSNHCYALQLFIDSFSQFDSLVVDDTYGAYLAAKELIENGNTNIVLIDNENDVYTKRLAGVKKAYEEYNIDLNQLMTITLEPNDDIEEKLKSFFTKHVPEGIISVTETLSQQVCLVLNSLQISIPNDVSLIVYDDSNWAKLCAYTAISQPSDVIVNNIKDLLKKGQTEKIENVVIQPLLVKRQSVQNRRK